MQFGNHILRIYLGPTLFQCFHHSPRSTGVLPFEHICRFITGLILSPNKTLQGIYDLQVWEGEAPSRRAMHEAVFESGWDGAAFIQQHWEEVAQAYQGRGRQVISLDWTLAHHERGPKIYAVTKSYDYVERRTTLFQTVVTAVVSNRDWIDGLEVVVQDPKDLKAEAAYLKATAKQSHEQMAEARGRLLELLLLTHPSVAVPQTDGDRGRYRTPVRSRRPVPAGPLCL
jgi:hypothetical protein